MCDGHAKTHFLLISVSLMYRSTVYILSLLCLLTTSQGPRVVVLEEEVQGWGPDIMLNFSDPQRIAYDRPFIRIYDQLTGLNLIVGRTVVGQMSRLDWTPHYPFVCLCTCVQFVWTWYLENPLRELSCILGKCPFGLKKELIRFGWSKIKGHSGLKKNFIDSERHYLKNTPKKILSNVAPRFTYTHRSADYIRVVKGHRGLSKHVFVLLNVIFQVRLQGISSNCDQLSLVLEKWIDWVSVVKGQRSCGLKLHWMYEA